MTKLAFPIIFILLSAGLFFIYIDPTYEDIKKIITEEQRVDEALDKSKELQEVRNRLLSKYNTFSTNDLNRLKKLLPDNVDNVRLILDIDHIASIYGMRLKDVVVSVPDNRQAIIIGPDNAPYKSVNLSFSLLSSYENMMNFIKDIERSLRIVDIIGISFTQLKSDSNEFYEYRIEIKTYWLK